MDTRGIGSATDAALRQALAPDCGLRLTEAAESLCDLQARINEAQKASAGVPVRRGNPLGIRDGWECPPCGTFGVGAVSEAAHAQACCYRNQSPTRRVVIAIERRQAEAKAVEMWGDGAYALCRQMDREPRGANLFVGPRGCLHGDDPSRRFWGSGATWEEAFANASIAELALQGGHDAAASEIP